MLEKLKSFKRESRLLQSYGLIASKNSKTDDLLNKLRVANIDEEKIDLVLKAFYEKEKKEEYRLKTWRDNNDEYAIYFHDEGTTEHEIRMELRKQLNEILSFEEFKAVFIAQMQSWIDRDAKEESEKLIKSYSFNDEQQQDLKNIINQKVTDKIITEQYYNYNWDLSQQKLRAVEYRYERKIRDKIRDFKEQNKSTENNNN